VKVRLAVRWVALAAAALTPLFAAEDPQALIRRLGAPATVTPVSRDHESGARPGSASGPGAGAVNFSFDQVDVHSFVKLVGEMTGRRFVVADSVKGKITVVSPQIPREEVYPVFLSILESVGCSVVEEGGICRVVPLSPRVVPLAPVVRPGDKSPVSGVVTKILRLQHVRASEVQKALLAKAGGGAATANVVAVEDSNHLIVTDTTTAIAQIEAILSELDRPGLTRASELVTLKHAAAEELAEQLNRAMEEREARGDSTRGRLPQIPGVRPSSRDVGFAVPVPRANSLLLVGTAAQIADMIRLIVLMDVDAVSGRGRLNAIFLKYLAAEEAAKRISALLDKSAAKVESARKREIAIEASPENNALLVDASPGDFEVVRQLVEQLDRVPQQVHIEVLILEHSSSDDLDVGVEMAALGAPKSEGDLAVVGGSKLSDRESSLLDSVQRGVFPRGLALGVVGGARVGPNGQMVYGVPGLINVNALKKEGQFRVVSETSLESQDNKDASVNIVNQIPITKSTVSGGAGTAKDVIQNIERLDVGIKLKLTPHIIPGGDVRMVLNPIIEAVSDPGPSGGVFAPTIAKREVTTTVTVRDGSTIVIAGLTREDTKEVRRRVPVLGKIPVLGFLFRQNVEAKEKTNMLILVTPRIVGSVAAAEALTKEWSEKTDLKPR
jgi:general secretion pathway protein D